MLLKHRHKIKVKRLLPIFLLDKASKKDKKKRKFLEVDFLYYRKFKSRHEMRKKVLIMFFVPNSMLNELIIKII